MSYQRLAIILGNCLFPVHIYEEQGLLAPGKSTLFFMAEDSGLCQHFRYHKHKLVLFLSAMRNHADQIDSKYDLYYHHLTPGNFELNYEVRLSECLNQHPEIGEIVSYEIEDQFFESRIKDYCTNRNLQLTILPSPGFLTHRDEFKDWLKGNKPLMQLFYQWQRKRLGILLTDDGKPLHGKWSFDAENRKALPKDIVIPNQPKSSHNQHDKDVIKLVDSLFPEHPGSTDNFSWATTRREALKRLEIFLKERFEHFGPYEDAIHKSDSFLFHSVLSPYINLGLITPDEVVDKCLEYNQQNQTHYPSVEGLIRQIIGWREFIRGIYNEYDLDKNHFGHKRRLKSCWYDGTTGIPPLDDSIKKCVAHGFTHHIERLMVIGNIMLMTELDPREVYRWFMEMFVDSSDWVMAPNVFDMSQFATGGIFATKPYIAGSNYILKMSNYQKGPWCDIMNGLYWRFIDRHRSTFANNIRMRMMLGTLDKMSDEKKNYLFKKAEKWIEEVSLEGGGES